MSCPRRLAPIITVLVIVASLALLANSQIRVPRRVSLKDTLATGLAQFRYAYETREPGSSGTFDYPLRGKILANPATPDALLAMIDLNMAWYRAAFVLDIAASLPSREARALVAKYMSHSSTPVPSLQAALQRAFPPGDEESLISAIATMRGGVFYEALVLLEKRTELAGTVPQRLFAMLDGHPEIYTALWKIAKYDWAYTFLKEQYRVLMNPASRVAVQTQVAASDAPPEDRRRWLWDSISDESSLACYQNGLYQLHKLEDPDGLRLLMQDVENRGVATESAAAWSWTELRQFAGRYPDGYLARGIREYESVVGRGYFGIDREPLEAWFEVYGDAKYDPKREIPGFERFLQLFGSHPGSDDAAYRLGRSYEVTGDYMNALLWQHRAASLPDGDVRYHAVGRLIYLLDVRIPVERLSALVESGELPSGLQAAVLYSYGVRLARLGQYDRAAEALLVALEIATEPTSFVLGGPYLVRQSITGQREAFLRLGGLIATGTASSLYDAGAAVFHDQLTFYNHLWAGNRQGFFWSGYLNQQLYGDAPIYLAEYVVQFNNYVQAYNLFSKVYSMGDRRLGERALFSMGRCLVSLDQYGEEAALVYSPSALVAKIVETFSRFAMEYPTSSMADDALLTAGIYSGDKSFFERIIRDYPKSDQASEASRRLATGAGPARTFRPVPHSFLLHPTDVPAEVRRQIDALGKQPPEKLVIHQRFAYLGTAWLPEGKSVSGVVEDMSRGTVVVYLGDARPTKNAYAIRFRAPGFGDRVEIAE